jgi:hypothetical protein
MNDGVFPSSYIGRAESGCNRAHVFCPALFRIFAVGHTAKLESLEDAHDPGPACPVIAKPGARETRGSAAASGAQARRVPDMSCGAAPFESGNHS